jgi:multiple sugar transport system permease protein
MSKALLGSRLEPKHKPSNHWVWLGSGLALLVVGVFLLASLGREARAPLALKNSVPLVPFLGLILLGQGFIAWRLQGKQRTAWLLAMPTVVFILAIVVLPTLYALGLSFVRWDIQIPERSFIFLKNYAEILMTSRVWNAFANTAVVALGAVGLELLFGLGLALLLVDRFPGRSVVMAVLMIPLTMAPVVVGQTWRMLWDTRFGAVNHVLSLLTGQNVHLLWLAKPVLATLAIIITDVWQWTPFVFLIILAGLMAINGELYEAAAIDGASAWDKFVRITLPLLRPVLLVVVLFRSLEALKLFDILFLLTRGGPGYSTENYTLYLYQQGFAFGRLGYTAAGSILFIVLVTVLATLLIRRIGER